MKGDGSSVLGLLIPPSFAYDSAMCLSGPLDLKWSGFADLTTNERFVVLPVIALMFALGLAVIPAELRQPCSAADGGGIEAVAKWGAIKMSVNLSLESGCVRLRTSRSGSGRGANPEHSNAAAGADTQPRRRDDGAYPVALPILMTGDGVHLSRAQKRSKIVVLCA